MSHETSNRPSFRIDHVTVAGRDLNLLRAAFRSVGFHSTFGGMHSNGITHMAVVPFADGAYLELISSVDLTNREHVFWPRHISADAGPCAWAIEVDDISTWCHRLRSQGIETDGPHHMTRTRPDGRVPEWDLAFVGDADYPGVVLPFLISDRTPRNWRIADAEGLDGVAGQPGGRPRIEGVARIVIAVSDPEPIKPCFDRMFENSDWAVETDEAFGACLHHAISIPVSLARPLDGPGAPDRLRDRLSCVGQGVCTLLLETADLDAVCRKYRNLHRRSRWLGQAVAMFDQVGPGTATIGFFEA